MKRYDAIIAGASFAGIACAKALSSRGCSVLLLERKADVGTGIRTTGILVDEARGLVDLPEGIVKPISQVRLYSPSLRHVEVRSERYLFYATDTPALMRHLLTDAQAAGVEVLLDTPFGDGACIGEDIVVNHGLAAGRFLIGADGARSHVAASFGLGRNASFLIGVEAEYTGITTANDAAFHCFLDQEWAPGYIGWIIPGPKVTQIGLATRHGEKPDIGEFYRHISPLLHQNNPEIVERRGGLIPVGGLVSPFHDGNVILLGDAAGIVSPLTAGGIHTAFYYGKRLGQLIAEHLQEAGPHPANILEAEYPRFRSKLLMRQVFNRIPNWGLNLMLASPLAQPIADAVFFLKKRLPRPRS